MRGLLASTMPGGRGPLRSLQPLCSLRVRRVQQAASVVPHVPQGSGFDSASGGGSQLTIAVACWPWSWA